MQEYNGFDRSTSQNLSKINVFVISHFYSLGSLLGPSWALLVTLWEPFGLLFGSLGRLLGSLRALWSSLGALLGSLGDLLGLSWGSLVSQGALRQHFRASREHFGRI